MPCKILFAAGEGGNLEFSINGVGYYMVYGSAAFQNWTILGIAPKSVVNANMNRRNTPPWP